MYELVPKPVYFHKATRVGKLDGTGFPVTIPYAVTEKAFECLCPTLGSCSDEGNN